MGKQSGKLGLLTAFAKERGITKQSASVQLRKAGINYLEDFDFGAAHRLLDEASHPERAPFRKGQSPTYVTSPSSMPLDIDRSQNPINYTIGYLGKWLGINLPQILRKAAACDPHRSIDVSDTILCLYYSLADEVSEAFDIEEEPIIEKMPWHGASERQQLIDTLERIQPNPHEFESEETKSYRLTLKGKHG